MDHEPLHRRIAGDIERRIASGEWRPGFRIPTEAELMAEYGCARMTVSRAMTDLSARALVSNASRMVGVLIPFTETQNALLLDNPFYAEIVSGIETSLRATLMNPVPIACWGLIVAALLIVGTIPIFVGLAVIMPILGHATWHLYRRIVVDER